MELNLINCNLQNQRPVTDIKSCVTVMPPYHVIISYDLVVGLGLAE